MPINALEGHQSGMRCLQCGKRISLLRKISNEEFCSAEHQALYRRGESQIALARLKESQVRIERPSPAAAAAAMAAVGRLRAMDASAGDPVFVTTYPIPERVTPRNQRRMSVPPYEPLMPEWDGALPDRRDRLNQGNFLSFAPAGKVDRGVAPPPMTLPHLKAAPPLRPQFRLGVRLLGSGGRPTVRPLRYAGLGPVVPPKPPSRRCRMLGIGVNCTWAQSIRANPQLPVLREKTQYSPEPTLQKVPALAIRRVIPAPVEVKWRPVPLPIDPKPLEPIGALPRQIPLRMNSGVVGIGELIRVAEPAPPTPKDEPASLQSDQPITLNLARGTASATLSSPAALEHIDLAAMPVLGQVSTPEHRLPSPGKLELVKPQSPGKFTLRQLTVKPVLRVPADLIPALTAPKFSTRLRRVETMSPVQLHLAKVAIITRRIPAIVVHPSRGLKSIVLPVHGPTQAKAVAVSPRLRDLRSLPVLAPAKRGRVLVSRIVGALSLRALAPSLPTHESLHTTLPRMKEESDLQLLDFPSFLMSTLVDTKVPKAMATAVGKRRPLLPEYPAYPDLLSGFGWVTAPVARPAAASRLAKSRLATPESTEPESTRSAFAPPEPASSTFMAPPPSATRFAAPGLAESLLGFSLAEELEAEAEAPVIVARVLTTRTVAVRDEDVRGEDPQDQYARDERTPYEAAPDMSARIVATRVVAEPESVPSWADEPEPEHPAIAARVLAAPEADSPISEETAEAAGPPVPPEEAGPPRLERQLPLAMGKAIAPGRPVIRQAARVTYHPLWDTAESLPPSCPTAEFTVDHADGSGSRQSQETETRTYRSFMPSIDLRGLPGRKFWTYAPADLKWVALGLPLILVFVVYSFRGSQPKTESVPVAAAPVAAAPVAAAEAPPAPSQPVVAETPKAVTPVPAASSSSFGNSLKNLLMNRAAVNLLDDFRSGLGAWQGNEGWASSWRYGQATFLEPGSLALYKPSLALRDYSLEFLGQIQTRSMNWVFRAKDVNNYYVVSLVLNGTGPLPRAQIVQYAVIDGKEERHKVMAAPYPIRPDTLYLVRMEVHGNNFSVFLQDQFLYNFTDDRLQDGGIGFFSPKGDKSYLRWVQIKHQYDYIGRLCALLAPYHVPEAAR